MHKFHSYLVGKFLTEESAGRLTRAELARRTKKSPAVITRLLSGPSNITISTLASLLIGICGEEPIPSSHPVTDQPASNKYPDLNEALANSSKAQNEVPDRVPHFEDIGTDPGLQMALAA